MNEITGNAVLPAEALDALIGLLRDEGYRVIGPTVRDAAVVLDEIADAGALPRGWRDAQGPGAYRLERTDSPAWFGFNLGADSWKRWLHPPERRLWRAERDEHGGISAEPDPLPEDRLAFLGARACDLAAIGVLDRVLMGGAHPDPQYRARREGALIVAVECASAAPTCFCSSMGTGPEVTGGFDIALTEIVEPDRHVFLLRAGSKRGERIAGRLETRPADTADLAAARAAPEAARAQIERHLRTEGLKDGLQAAPDHPRWDDVAERCLTCGNCTMVCPTCFCSTVEDRASLDGAEAERWQRWDVCFSLDFSFAAGGAVRRSSKARYRQWLTHKLSSWVDQFGEFGCIGCGRCITWCPVGIDIVEEAAAVAFSDGHESEADR